MKNIKSDYSKAKEKDQLVNEDYQEDEIAIITPKKTYLNKLSKK